MGSPSSASIARVQVGAMLRPPGVGLFSTGVLAIDLVSLHQCLPVGGSSFDCRSSLESVAADAAELLDHLHIPAAVVVGMSGLCTGPVCAYWCKAMRSFAMRRLQLPG